MSRTYSISLGCLVVFLITVAGSHGNKTSESPKTPPAPEMPAHWRVTSDTSFSSADIEPVAERMGAGISALRNTVYEVNGKRVQLNLIVAPDKANADKIMKALRKVKPDDFLLRKELTLFEFVGADNALQEMREGKAHIKNGS